MSSLLCGQGIYNSRFRLAGVLTHSQTRTMPLPDSITNLGGPTVVTSTPSGTTTALPTSTEDSMHSSSPTPFPGNRPGGRGPKRSPGATSTRTPRRPTEATTTLHQTSGIPYGHVPAYLPGSASLVEELDQRVLIVLRDGTHVVGVRWIEGQRRSVSWSSVTRVCVCVCVCICACVLHHPWVTADACLVDIFSHI